MGATIRVALDPEDWFRATWRKLPPLARPEELPFDAADCLERLAKVPPAPSYTEDWSWARARLSPALSPEEAAFWLRAMLGSGQATPPARLAAKWADAPPATPFRSPKLAVLRKVLGRRRCPPPELWVPLVSVLGVVEAVEQVLLLEEETVASSTYRSWYGLAAFISLSRGFQRYVVPFLTETERGDVRELVHRRIDLTAWPKVTYGPVPLPLLFAAALGFPDEMRALIRGSSPDDELHRQVHDILFGLGSPAEVIAERERLKLPLDRALHIRPWLAHTELSALDPVRDAILAEKRKGTTTPLIGALGLARDPETAAIMIELAARSKAPDAARAWLQRYPAISIPAMLKAATGRGKAANVALSLLRSLSANRHETEIAQAIETSGCPSRVREALISGPPSETQPQLPTWMEGAADDLITPAWISVRELPEVTVDGEPLPYSAVASLLAALTASTLKAPHPLVIAAHANADPHTLDLFAWRLYELWRQHGMKHKESWALGATGLLGGDGCALKLGSLAKELRTALRHQQAALALECLKAIGTDTALLQLRNFTRLPREWSLKVTAAQHLEAIATTRGLSMEQLEDRMVPVCGLDERGSCIYDYGSRLFTLVMAPGLKPVVREENGRTRELPKPGAKDDPTKAPAAYAAWGVLKRQLGDVARMQSRRLELAMIDGRRWSTPEFEELLVRHPVMTHFARGLVWGAYSKDGELQDTFRVAEDQSYAGPDDARFALPPTAVIGLPHPLNLSIALIGAWGERFGDYELAPPFPQLGRPVFTPQAAERAAMEVRRFAGIPCMAVALLDGLERRGWRREEGDRCSQRFRRAFPGAGTTALLEIAPGFELWDPRHADDQTLESASFSAVGGTSLPEDRLPLGEVDPIAFSEVIADLAAVTRRV